MPIIEGEERPMVQYTGEATFRFREYLSKMGSSHSRMDAVRGVLETELMAEVGGDYTDVRTSATSSGGTIDVQATIEVVSVGYTEEDENLFASNMVTCIERTADTLSADGIQDVEVGIADLVPGSYREIESPEYRGDSNEVIGGLLE